MMILVRVLMNQRLVQHVPLAAVAVPSQLKKHQHQRLALRLVQVNHVKKHRPPKNAAPSVLVAADQNVVLAGKLAFRLRKEPRGVRRLVVIEVAIRIEHPTDLNVRSLTLNLRPECVTSARTIWTLATTNQHRVPQNAAVVTVVMTPVSVQQGRTAVIAANAVSVVAIAESDWNAEIALNAANTANVPIAVSDLRAKSDQTGDLVMIEATGLLALTVENPAIVHLAVNPAIVHLAVNMASDVVVVHDVIMATEGLVVTIETMSKAQNAVSAARAASKIVAPVFAVKAMI